MFVIVKLSTELRQNLAKWLTQDLTKMTKVEPKPRPYFLQPHFVTPHTEAVKHRKQHPQKPLALFLRALWCGSQLSRARPPGSLK